MLLTKHGRQALPTDPTARRVIEALDDDEFDFRTVRGVGDALDLPDETIQQVLDDHDELVRISAAPGPQGEALYTLRSRPITAQESFAVAQAALEKSVR